MSGLHYLCRQTSTGENLKIRLLNAGKRELPGTSGGRST